MYQYVHVSEHLMKKLKYKIPNHEMFQPSWLLCALRNGNNQIFTVRKESKNLAKQFSRSDKNHLRRSHYLGRILTCYVFTVM